MTGLVWQTSDASTGVAWTARSCPATWRVPTVDELYSLVDDRIVPGTTAVADPVFGLTAGAYWTNDIAGSSYAWSVNFLNGSVGDGIQSPSYRVRCVR